MFNSRIRTILVLLLLVTSPVTTWAALSQNQVSQLYVSIFGRASEGGGNTYWQGAYPDLIATANAMLESPAGKDYFGNSLDTNQSFIEHIYKNTLNKTINDDPDGIAYWVKELEKTSKGEVVSRMVDAILKHAPGKEYYNPNNQKAMDAYNQFNNRVKVSNYMANNVEDTPENWQVVTAFSKGLVVTYDSATLSSAMERVKNLDNNSTDPNPSESEIKTKIKERIQTFESIGDASPMMDELNTIIQAVMSGDPSVVTMNPSLEALQNINIQNLPQEITANFDFGSGYTPEGSNSIYTGSGKILVSNIKLSQEPMQIKAKADLTANNIKRDGRIVLNGGASTGVDIKPSQSGDSIGLSLEANFNNLTSLDQSANGSVSLSTKVSLAEKKLIEPLKIQFNQFNIPDISISGLMAIKLKTNNIHEVDFDLTTPKGPIAGLLQIEQLSDQTIKLTIPSGKIHMEEFDISMPNGLIIDKNDSSCGHSTKGDIVVTDGKETSTIQLNGCDYKIN